MNESFAVEIHVRDGAGDFLRLFQVEAESREAAEKIAMRHARSVGKDSNAYEVIGAHASWNDVIDESFAVLTEQGVRAAVAK